MSSYTKDDVLEFLDFAGRKGMMKKGTVSSYKAACNAILSIFDDDGSGDLSEQELDDVFLRYENLHSLKFKPDTLRIYKQRVTNAIREFLAYRENPAAWKPTQAQRSSGAGRISRGSRVSGGGNGQSNANKTRSRQGSSNGADSAQQIEYQFPLRKDTIVAVSGIPFDVKRTEMARFTAFLSNLVAEGDDDRVVQPMLPLPQGIEE